MRLTQSCTKIESTKLCKYSILYIGGFGSKEHQSDTIKRFKSEFEETFSVIRKNQEAMNSQNEMVESISKYEKLTWY